MGRHTPTSLELFPGERRPSSKEAWEIVERFPVGCRLAQETSQSHGGRYKNGPYWFAYVRQGHGRPLRIYVGTDARKRRIELAWEIVSEELAEAANTPAVKRLRAMEARAGKLARTSATVDVPIVEVRAQRPK
jgi:hypothetical protein